MTMVMMMVMLVMIYNHDDNDTADEYEIMKWRRWGLLGN